MRRSVVCIYGVFAPDDDNVFVEGELSRMDNVCREIRWDELGRLISEIVGHFRFQKFFWTLNTWMTMCIQ